MKKYENEKEEGVCVTEKRSQGGSVSENENVNENENGRRCSSTED